MAEYIEREAVLKIIDDNCPHDKGGYNTEEEMGAGAACYYIRKAVNDIPTADAAPRAEWISVRERLPDENEYLTHHNDGIDTLKRLTIAYMTDTIEYTIGCYDGHKWMNQLGNKKINDVVAWKPFNLYEPPKTNQ